jgi:hypothetical protein
MLSFCTPRDHADGVDQVTVRDVFKGCGRVVLSRTLTTLSERAFDPVAGREAYWNDSANIRPAMVEVITSCSMRWSGCHRSTPDEGRVTMKSRMRA